ncbi:NUDIX family hydrolase protein [Rutstroemia sp. NJR-2017a WRK4]|nr:NUDIX family hydrolase protein [Rutstroemia sp. NJR-2017a WRK4]
MSFSSSPSLTTSLHQTLLSISQNPCPYVPNPPNCPRRASVALVLRIRASREYPAPSTPQVFPYPEPPTADRLADFFSQAWVQNGDPEVLFIKRAAREGDRWTSHVALPGGKKDPSDRNDREVAIRETSEEVGLELRGERCISVGNLPERVVSTSWGSVPIMVLCPFIFLWIDPSFPPLQLQPAEIASTHWVPIRVLLSPSVRTYEHVNVSDRFAKQGGPILKSILKPVIGKMRFSAIKLRPSESLYCSSTKEFFSEGSEPSPGIFSRFRTWLRGGEKAQPDRPLLLWGLTLGMVADFLDQLPPYDSVDMWEYPTFTSPDTRIIINVLTRNIKKRNAERLRGKDGIGNQTAMDGETKAVATEGLGKNIKKEDAVGVMLDGYYDLMKKGVWISAIIRLFSTLALILWIVRQYRIRRRR